MLINTDLLYFNVTKKMKDYHKLTCRGRSFDGGSFRERSELSRLEMSLHIFCKSACATRRGVCTCSSRKTKTCKTQTALRNAHKWRSRKGKI